MSYCSFCRSLQKSERAITLFKRAIAHFQNEQMANPGCRVGQLLICSFAHCSFPHLFKRAIEQSLFLLLFAKERMSNRSFFVLFKRATKRAIALSLFQKRVIALSLFQKEQKSVNEQKISDFPFAHFSLQKKERSLIFKTNECPTLLLCTPLRNQYLCYNSLIQWLFVFRRKYIYIFLTLLYFTTRDPQSSLLYIVYITERKK